MWGPRNRSAAFLSPEAAITVTTGVETLDSLEPAFGFRAWSSLLPVMPSGVAWWPQGASLVPLQLARVARNHSAEGTCWAGHESHLGFHSDFTVLYTCDLRGTAVDERESGVSRQCLESSPS